MHRIASLLLTLTLLAAPGAAMAHGCPNHIAQIDQLLESRDLPEDTRSEIRTLRDEGESAHNAGHHDRAMEKLDKALRKLAEASVGESIY